MDTLVRSLTRSLDLTGDPLTADRLAVNLVRAGRLSFLDFIAPPVGRWGRWSGPSFGTDGRYRLSIQAGYGKYSDPRQDGLAAADYSEWELAIVDETGLIAILSDPIFDTMPGRDHWEGERMVGPYVPTETVQQAFAWMVLTFGAPRLAPQE